MRCDNAFCIYQQKGGCLLNKIEIDGAGRCGECTEIDLPEQYLEYEKERSRKKLE